MSYMSDRLARKNGILPPLPTKKEKKPIPKKSAKKIAEEKEQKKENGGEETELTKWYRQKMKLMDRCYWTGQVVEKHVFHYAKMSICHILEKSKCPGVKTHPLNFIILIPDLHKKFDEMSWEEREQLPFWDIIRDRLVMIYPDLPPSENRHFPESVLKYMQEKEPF